MGGMGGSTHAHAPARRRSCRRRRCACCAARSCRRRRTCLTSEWRPPLLACVHLAWRTPTAAAACTGPHPLRRSSSWSSHHGGWCAARACVLGVRARCVHVCVCFFFVCARARVRRGGRRRPIPLFYVSRIVVGVVDTRAQHTHTRTPTSRARSRARRADVRALRAEGVLLHPATEEVRVLPPARTRLARGLRSSSSRSSGSGSRRRVVAAG